MLRRFQEYYKSNHVPALHLWGATPNRWGWVRSKYWPRYLSRHQAGRPGQISRLMATVYTDIVGYSRLFALDDTGTADRLLDLHRRLVAPVIRRHHGELRQTAGDSMLITFDSVADAVQCAVNIQSEVATENEGWSRDRQMRLRVGVDLGDVIMNAMGFHGDGVIIAARLQAVCPPGAVCVSRAVHDRGGERLGLNSESLGLLTLKNVPRPVEAFVLWPPHGRPDAKVIDYAKYA
jgi:adenylate cyclase